MFASSYILYVIYNFIYSNVLTIFVQLSSQYGPFLKYYIIIITHSERALFNLNARVEARGIIVPKAVGRGYYDPERRHKGI